MEDSSFREEVELYRVIMEVSDEVDMWPEFNADTAWNDLNSRIEVKTQPMWYSRPWVGAAAAVVLLLVSWFVFNGRDTSDQTGLSLLAHDNTQLHELNDGSLIYLTQGSELIVSGDFDELDRKVILNGRAYFDVSPLKEFPFTVVSGEAVVTVTGTQFDLSPDQLLVTEGQVLLDNLHSEFTVVSGHGVDLSTNEEIVSDEVPNYSWINGAMVFNNVSLKHIIEQTEQHFQVRILISESRLDERYTVSLEDLDLDQVLNVLSKLTQTEISKDSQGYILE